MPGQRRIGCRGAAHGKITLKSAGIRHLAGALFHRGARGGIGIRYEEENLQIVSGSTIRLKYASNVYTPLRSIIQYPTSREVKSMAKKGSKKQPKEPQE
ncbi:hypothetical protein [Methanofollis ethanolicus]|uniref:hypothetical protein n=1 Tax=Methanofollis ethanolicus TaxID=488124 RepID=UPI00082A955B|nr:hypothetical protein [Methanofollis ethanolicus]